MDRDTTRAGLLYGLGAYIIWGFFPIYWKFLDHVDSLEILAHRMTWSLIFVLAVLGLRKRAAWVRKLLETPKEILIYGSAATILAVNWGLYIWAVNSGFIVETSLGYFINPLINVVFGALFLGERPRVVQWVAIGLAAVGVGYLTVIYGQPPWIALVLAVSFATYGLLKKKGSLGAVEGLSVETALLFLPALAYLVFVETSSGGAFGHSNASTHLMLAGSGIATALPLLFFAAAVRRLTLTVIGVLQYLAPTLQFLIGVYVYNEPFSAERLVGFVFIWIGLLVFTAEGVVRRRRLRKETPPPTI